MVKYQKDGIGIKMKRGRTRDVQELEPTRLREKEVEERQESKKTLGMAR